MAGQQYIAWNGAMPAAAAAVVVTTGTAIKTLLQIQTPATQDIRIIRWGISFDGSAAATPIKCELLTTAAVAATVTAHIAAGVMPYNNAGSPASLMTLGTTGTGYTASAEGTVVTTRLFDYQLVSPTSQYVYDWSLGSEPHVPVSTILRVRVTAAAAVNAACFVVWAE